MAIVVQNFSTNVGVIANVSNDTYAILPNVFVTAVGDAIDGDDANGNKTILVHGGLVSEDDGIDLGLSGNLASGGNEVRVYATGSIFGEDRGVESEGGFLLLVNHGSIFGREDGVFATGPSNIIVNYGMIEALDEGIELSGDGSRVMNYGFITSSDFGEAVEMNPLVGEVVSVLNYGTIDGSGGFGAIDGNQGTERVVNKGTIIGDVDLKGGNDHFDSRGGTVQGLVEGGSGNDVYLIDNPDIVLLEFGSQGTDTVGTEVSYALKDNFENLELLGADHIDGFGNSLDNLITPNLGANLIDGSDGIDTVDYGDAASPVVAQLFGQWDFGAINPSSLASVTAPMARTAGGGGADGDILLNVEILSGSAFDDALVGSHGDDELRGQAGDDTLFGNRGDDILEGGSGIDEMRGGLGSDTAAYTGSASPLIVDLVLTGNNTSDAAGDSYVNVENLRGSANNDVLNGNFAANVIEGLGGNDSMRGRGGGDTYEGGAGSDTFIFQNGFAAETVLDFDALDDNEKIDLSGVSEITDFTDLFNNHLSISGGDSLISAGSGVITLAGVSVVNLDANDFAF